MRPVSKRKCSVAAKKQMKSCVKKTNQSISSSMATDRFEIFSQLKSVTALEQYPKYCELLSRKELPILQKTSVDMATAELLIFLTIKSQHGEEVSPSLLVDELWHAMLLMPCFYQQVCAIIAPGEEMIDHDPLGGVDAKARRERYEKTKQYYEEMRPFGAWIKELWPDDIDGMIVTPQKDRAVEIQSTPITVPSHNEEEEVALRCNRKSRRRIITFHVKSSSSEDLSVKMHIDQRMNHLFKAYADHHGFGVHGLRFTLDGAVIAPDATPEKLEMEDGDQVDVIIPMAGC